MGDVITNHKLNVQMVISALGKDRVGLFKELAQGILDSGCSVLDSRMAALGSEFAAMMLVAGNWNSIAKLEGALPALQDKLKLTLTSRRAEARAAQGNLLPYMVEVVTVDRPGILYRLADFFAKRNINIEDLYTASYTSTHSETNMFNVNITVNVPADVHIAGLREEFLNLCDELNLDGVLEPLKR